MPKEDLTENYIEVDVAANRLEVVTNRVTATDLDRDEEVYVYRDLSADFFDEIDLKFEIFLASTSVRKSSPSVSPAGGMAIANVVDDVFGQSTTDVNVLIALEPSGTRIFLERGVFATDAFSAQADTRYYCRMTRPAGGDTVTLRIFTNAGLSGTPEDTLTVSGFGTVKWRYLYAFTGLNTGSSGVEFDGDVSNLEVTIPVMPVTPISRGKVRLELESGPDILLLEDGSGLLLEEGGHGILKGGISTGPGPGIGRAPAPIADKLTAPENFTGTAPEFAVFQALNKLGFEDRFEFQSSKFGGRSTRGGLILDFFIPSLSLGLSVLGSYWHYFRGGQQGIDLLQRQQLESSGIRVVFLDEEDVLANAEYFVADALRGIDHSRLVRGF